MLNLLLCGVCSALYLIGLVMFIILHRLDRRVHILHDAVSLYAQGTHGAWFRVYGHIGTLAALLFTLQTASVFPARVTIAMSLLIIFRLGVVWVPTDAKDAPASLQGRLHLLLAIATFAATYTAITNATDAFLSQMNTPMAFYLNVLRDVAMLALGAVVITMLPACKRYFGVSERLFLLAAQLWFLSASFWFFVQSIRRLSL